MKSTIVLALSAALSIASSSAIAQSNAMQTQDNSSQNMQSSGEQEAMHMVPAKASLIQTLDAKKAALGSEFRVHLDGTVNLNNGPKLPSGTTLVGTVVQDDSQDSSASNGTSRLALRFTQAMLKDGSTIPVRATILAVARADDPSNGMITTDDQTSSSWKDGTMQVDAIEVMNHVDLHSKLASNNSGVFVATDNRNIKLGQGTEFALAIAQLGNQVPQQSGN